MNNFQKKISKDIKLNNKYITSGDEYFSERMKDPEFKKAWEEECLRFDIAQLIYKSRKKKNISQVKLAKKAQTTQKVISKIENCEVSIGIDLLHRIARSLGVKVCVSFK